MRVAPPLDQGFVPASLFNREFRKLCASGGVPLKLALERADGCVSTFSTQVVVGDSRSLALSQRYVERIVKFLLWQRGGWKVYVGGPAAIGEYIKAAYAPGGASFRRRIHGRRLRASVHGGGDGSR